MTHSLARVPLSSLWVPVVAGTVLVSLLAFAFPAAWLALLVPGIAIATVRPPVGLAFLAASVPAQTFAAFPVADVQVTLTKACVVCVVAGWLLRARHSDVPLDTISWGYGLVLVALTVSVVATNEFETWLSEVYQWTVALVVYLIARATIRSLRDIETIVLGMAAGVVGVSTWSLIQVARDDGPPSFFVNGVLRAYGTFGEPNPFAAYLELVLPILAAVVVLPRLHGSRPWRLNSAEIVMTVGLVLGAANVVLTQSRGGWLGIACGGLILALAMPRRMQYAGAVVLTGAVLAAWVSSAFDFLMTRMTSLGAAGERWRHVTPESWADEERRAHWGAAWRMMVDHPLTGVGAGEFSERYREYTPEWRFRVSRGHAHNGPLHVGATTGIFGLVAYVGWMLTALVTLVARLDDTRWPARAVVVGCLAAFVSFTVHSLVDYLTVLSLGIQIALVLAVGRTALDNFVSAPEKDPERYGSTSR